MFAPWDARKGLSDETRKDGIEERPETINSY